MSGHPLGRFWACEPAAARDYRRQLGALISGRIQPTAASAARQRTPPTANQGKLGVIPIRGCLTDHRSWISDALSWDTYDAIGTAADQFAKDPDISAVVLDVDSGGGSVFGAQECADRIWNLAQVKPVVGFVNAYAASAAFWLASQSNLLLMMPSGQVGSVGVLLIHQSFAGANEQAGVEVSYLTSSAAPKKAEGNSDFPLGDEARAYQLKQLDQYHSAFASAVARGRRTTVSKVGATFGQGRTMGSDDALAVGMVCGREVTLLNVFARAARGEGAPKGNTRAAAPAAPLSAMSTQALINERALLDAERASGDYAPAKLSRWIEIDTELDARREAEHKAEVAAATADRQARIAALQRK